MKTHSDIEIPVFQNLGTNRWYYHFNHKGKVVNDEFTGEQVIYEADTVIIEGLPNLNKVQAALNEAGLVSNTLETDIEQLQNEEPI
jgi:hypothetical protein